MKKALVTGITGQDGSYLAELLLSKGYEVHGIIRRASSFNTGRINHIFQDPHTPRPNLLLHYGDLSDASNISRLIEKTQPDEIYHLGAQSHVRVSFDMPEYTADVTGMGTIRLLDAIKEANFRAKFYQASSSEMFGKVCERPQTEATPFYPRSPYGCAKVFAYWMTKNYRESYGMFAVNGILFNHESPRRGETFVTKKITKALVRIKLGLQDKLYVGNLAAKRDWGYAKDYVEGMWLMMQQAEPSDYILATGETHSVREFIEETCRLLSIDLVWQGAGLNEQGLDRRTGQIIILIDPKYFRPSEVDLLVGDYSKAKRELGWEPTVRFKELVKLMVEADYNEYSPKSEFIPVMNPPLASSDNYRFMPLNAKIYVAGHQGLVGSALVRQLKSRGYNNLILRTRQELDLLDQAAVNNFFEQAKPEFVFLAAAKVGGIMANKEHKADFIYENLSIQNNIIYNAYRAGVKKLLFLGSSCIYPKLAPQPLKEEYLMSDKLEETNDAYALAKIAGIKMCQGFNQQYGTNFIAVMPTNLYGPNDNFDLNSGHVIPAMIRRFYEAKLANQPSITLWGTGSAFREFLHVDDLADACLFLMNNYHSSEIINIGTGSDLSIKELAETIKKLVGYEGEIIWDTDKPDGTPRKLLAVSRLQQLGWQYKISLTDGLKQTIEWFINNQPNNQRLVERLSRSAYKIPLMKNAFLCEVETKKLLADFILQTNCFSMSVNCQAFERAFAAKQGRRFAILFNSGSSANLALLQALKNLDLIKENDLIGFSALTWSTNVMPIMQLGLKPVPIDCQPQTLNVMSDNLQTRLKTEPLKALFITNALGFVGDLEAISRLCQETGIILLEDNCEALGTETLSGKSGNFGLASTFSFFVAHHMSTIEGGMVCTDDERLDDMLKIVRANGWDRNLSPASQTAWRHKFNINSEFEAKYAFYDLGYNLRPTEITGFLGLNQLKYLDDNIKVRTKNYWEINKVVGANSDFISLEHQHIKHLSSFALPFVCQTSELRDKYLAIFAAAGIECRPIIAGNIQKQPFYLKYIDKYYDLPGADILHQQGFYCGNYPELTASDLATIKNCLIKCD